jgi:signal peptidase II
VDDDRAGAGPGPALRAFAWALALTGLVFALDQVTKQAVVDHVVKGDPVEVALGVKISNVRNDGIAFGLLQGAADGVVLALTIGALAMLVAYFAAHATRPDLWLAVGLVVGGALGNLADRIRIGAAIDFVDPPLWPAFNVADIAIVVGVGLLVLALLAPAESDEHVP